jgi:predicted nucleic acid-binding protein
MRMPPLGGEVVLADPSAINRAEHPSVCQEVAAALNAQQIVTCSVVTRELLYSARTRRQLEDLEAAQSTLRDIPMTDSSRRAHRDPRAAAQDAGVGVLHYDRHFDRLAEVLHFRSVWLAPAGSL